MTDLEKEDYIQKLLGEAYNFYENEEYQKSLDCLEKVSEVDKNNALAYSLKGIVLSSLEKYENAIEEYTKAIELLDDNNDKAEIYFNKGNALDELKKYKEAVKAFDISADLSEDKKGKAKAYFNMANTLDNLNKDREAIKAYEKAYKFFEDDDDKAVAYFYKGNNLNNLNEDQRAIEAYDKAIELFGGDIDKALIYANKGDIFYKLEKYPEAVETYDRAINLFEDENDKAAVYYSKGDTLNELKEYQKAIEVYDKAILFFKDDNDKAHAYGNKGNVLSKLGNHIEALKSYEKASKLFEDDNNKAEAFFYKALVLHNKMKNREAIESYNKAIKLYKDNNNKAKAYLFKGIAINELKLYSKAIGFYDKAINLYIEDNTKGEAYLLKSTSLFQLRKYEEAIIGLKEALKLNSNLKNANQLIALSYLKLETWMKAGEFFGKEGTEIIEIISSLDEEDEKAHVSDIICSHLKHKPNDYFWKVLERTNVCKTTDRPCDQHIESCSDCKIEQVCGVYRNIYLKSLQIIANVQVNFAFEEKVAHYTTKDSARLLLLGKNGKKVSKDDKKPSKFRLASTARANDPKEGQTLFDYLLGNQQQTPIGTSESNYRAFIGCFTFNLQSLNQFRLYGKEKGREASGVSIVIKKDYFNKDIEVTQNMKANLVNIDKDIESSTQEEEKKLPLFRCIYIDPETEAVISLGHKELYAYIREEMDTKNEKKIDINDLRYNYGEYLKNIEEQLDKVTELLEQLKELVSNPDLNPQTVSELLLMLSHLVKHVAFKEEQECRILEIASLTDGDETVKVESEIDNNTYRMFIDYLPMTDSVDRLYMGNQFEDFAMFKDLIKQQYQGKVKCLISTHPFAIT